MGHDPQHPAQDQRGEPKRSTCVDGALQPCAYLLMLRRVLAMRVHEHVHVWQDQRRPSIRSRSAAESSRSTPGSVPPAPNGWIEKRSPNSAARNASVCLSASSIRDVSVVCSAAALCLAAARRLSSSRTVVLTNVSIHARHIYV